MDQYVLLRLACSIVRAAAASAFFIYELVYTGSIICYAVCVCVCGWMDGWMGARDWIIIELGLVFGLVIAINGGPD